MSEQLTEQRAEPQAFPTLPDDFRGAAALVQRQFSESIESLDKRVSGLTAEQGSRRRTAATLKVISVASSLLIAAGAFSGVTTQVLGGAIAGVAALERVFANMSRLLAIAAGKSAFERVRRQVVAEHNKKIIEVVRFHVREPEKSADLLISFVGELRDRLDATRDQIETALANNSYENLGKLSLEEHQEKAPNV
jgi:hypothetical protein